MRVIGLTGGIATGKSTVSQILAEEGFPIIDADLIAREVVQPGEPAYRDIVHSFGEEILNNDGTINRKLLGRLVFGEPAFLQSLNQITHPRIIEEINRRLQALREKGAEVAILDAPLLIETKLHLLVDEVWVVTCPRELQIKRLQERDNLSAAEAEARIKAQMPLEQKISYARQVIDNSKDKAHTRRQVQKILRSYLLPH
ncbi:MAG TPA: dephospho-CoA kinase [Firmicutes bacterium]|jgi:dephospho-CoA kinase|nr:dephospho-CoA kinase [Bacillota bacterium]